MLAGRQVLIPPDAPAIAARLAEQGLPRVSLLHAALRSADRFAQWSFVAADPDRTSTRLDPLADDPDFAPVPAGSPFADVPRWIGVIPYECLRSIERPAWTGPDRRPAASLSRPVWHRFRSVVCIDERHGHVLAMGRTAAEAGRLAARLRDQENIEHQPLRIEIAGDEAPSRHIERVAAALELIARGDLYQVNLARRIRVFLHEGSPLSLYLRLNHFAPSWFGACLDLGGGASVLSTTPELLLRAESRHSKNGAISDGFSRLFTIPIKGTCPRGNDALSDQDLAAHLDKDPKECAELAMILDVERNDLGRIAEVGSVRIVQPPHVVTHRTVHHRQALLTARAREGLSREDVLRSMLPSGSVTGAPKVRAMEVIATLEASRRGLYTGAIGVVGHDGGVTLAMAIRTVVLDGRQGEYWAGGGIVADSDPERELAETQWKALQLERVLGDREGDRDRDREGDRDHEREGDRDHEGATTTTTARAGTTCRIMC